MRKTSPDSQAEGGRVINIERPVWTPDPKGNKSKREYVPIGEGLYIGFKKQITAFVMLDPEDVEK